MPEDQEPSRLFMRQTELGSPPENAGKIHVEIFVDNERQMDCIVDKEYAEVMKSLCPRPGVLAASSTNW